MRRPQFMECQSLFFSFFFAWSLLLSPARAQQLSFRDDGTFKIAFFTDLHYGESKDKDAKNDQIQRTIMKAERPDLVVFGGDLLSGWESQGRFGWTSQHWRQVMAPVMDYETPYCVILGNHDAEAGDLSRRSILIADSNIGGKLSLTKLGPLNITGASNYWLEIKGRDSSAPEARLWLLDSMSKGCNGVDKSWGCVERDTVEWAKKTAAGLPSVPTSLAFIHIPIPEIISVWMSPTTKGRRGEESSCPLVDTGVFDALSSMRVQAVFSGHDHRNDYYGRLPSSTPSNSSEPLVAAASGTASSGTAFSGTAASPIMLGYGRKTGYGSYGPSSPGRNEVTHGARIIQLRQGRPAYQMQTWVANEFGQREVDSFPPRPKSRPQAVCSGGVVMFGRGGGLFWWAVFVLAFVVDVLIA